MSIFCGEIEETPANICGQIADRYVIEAPIDDLVKRDFLMFQVYNMTTTELVSAIFLVTNFIFCIS